MLTPYDWQEGIGHRAQFVESRLAQGAPILAISRPEGIVMVTGRRQVPKLVEIYDRMALGAIGQQSDVEAIRVAAVEFAHREGFNRSEEDVTVQRLVAGLSTSIKRAFSDFNTSPIVARALFAEVNESPAADVFVVLDFDGDYRTHSLHAAVVGKTPEFGLDEALSEIQAGPGTLKESTDALVDLWKKLTPESGDLTLEGLLLDRSPLRENRFRTLSV